MVSAGSLIDFDGKTMTRAEYSRWLNSLSEGDAVMFEDIWKATWATFASKS
jgi:hypothetical protein